MKLDIESHEEEPMLNNEISICHKISRETWEKKETIIDDTFDYKVATKCQRVMMMMMLYPKVSMDIDK